MNTYLQPKGLQPAQDGKAQPGDREAALSGMVSARALVELLTELRDLAYLLDRRGEPAAADLATSTALRLQEIVSTDREQ